MSSARKSLIPTTSTDHSDCLRFLNWLGTIGVELEYGPGIHEAAVLLNGLGDGTKLLQILDVVVPGSVNWSKVEMETKSNSFKVLANCNYLLETLRSLGVQCHLITANQIQQKNIKSLLSLLWIMMREYFRRRLNIVSEEEFNAEADKFIPTVEVDVLTTDGDEIVHEVKPEDSPEFEPLRQVFFYGYEGEVFAAYHDEASQIDCEPLPEDFSYLNRVALKPRESHSEKLDHAILHLKTRWKTMMFKRSKFRSRACLDAEFEIPNLPDKAGKTIEDQLRKKVAVPRECMISKSLKLQVEEPKFPDTYSQLPPVSQTEPDLPIALKVLEQPNRNHKRSHHSNPCLPDLQDQTNVSSPTHPKPPAAAPTTQRTPAAAPTITITAEAPTHNDTDHNNNNNSDRDEGEQQPQKRQTQRSDRSQRSAVGVFSARRGYFLLPAVAAGGGGGEEADDAGNCSGRAKNKGYSSSDPRSHSGARDGLHRSHNSSSCQKPDKLISGARGYSSNQEAKVGQSEECEGLFLSIPGEQFGTAAFESLPTSRFGEERNVLTEVTNHIVPLANRRSNLPIKYREIHGHSGCAKENQDQNCLALPDSLGRSKSRQKSVLTTQKAPKYSINSNSDILVGIGINGPTLLELLLESQTSKPEYDSQGGKSLKVELLKKHHFTRFRIGRDTKPSVPFFLKVYQNLNKEGLLRAIKSNRYFVHSRVLLNNVQDLNISEIARPQFHPEAKNLNQSAFSLTMDAGCKSQIATPSAQAGGYVSVFTARMALEKIAYGLPQESQSRRTILELLSCLENLLAPSALQIKTGSCTPIGVSQSASSLYLPQVEALPTVFNTLKLNRLLTASQRLLVRRAEYIIERARNQVSTNSGSWTPQNPIIPAAVFSPPQLVITPLDISPN